MRKKKFFFIVFEGIEGTGKSYQINKLYNNSPIINCLENKLYNKINKILENKHAS